MELLEQDVHQSVSEENEAQTSTTYTDSSVTQNALSVHYTDASGVPGFHYAQMGADNSAVSQYNQLGADGTTLPYDSAHQQLLGYDSVQGASLAYGLTDTSLAFNAANQDSALSFNQQSDVPLIFSGDGSTSRELFSRIVLNVNFSSLLTVRLNSAKLVCNLFKQFHY